MIKLSSRTSNSSSTPHPFTSAARPLVTLTPFPNDQPSRSSSTIRSYPTSYKPLHTTSDPLHNFRADSTRPPARPHHLNEPIPLEDNMQGIEDVTASQWDACPPGRSRNGRSSSSAHEAAQGSDDEMTRWGGEGGSSSRKRKVREGTGGETVFSKSRRNARYALSPSTSPVGARNIQQSSPISRSGAGEDLDAYTLSMVDDETPPDVRSGRRSGGAAELSEEEAEHSVKDESEEGSDTHEEKDEEEEAADSEQSSSPFPDSLITPHPAKAKGFDIEWTPSPTSPRSMARRNRSSSSATVKNRERVSETPPFINDSPVHDGEAGPSSSVSVRTRSTSRKAAVKARARSRNYYVLSDNEDEDYDPLVEGHEDAFTSEYKRQVEQEAGEPEETDGSDGDDDMRPGTQAGNGSRTQEGEGEEDDFIVLATQQPPPKAAPSARKKQVATTVTFNNQAQVGPSRIPLQPPPPPKNPIKVSVSIDDYASHFDDFFDGIDLEEIVPSNPSNTSQSGPVSRLNELFSSPASKRPPPISHNTSSSRTPLSDLPIPNTVSRPSHSRPSLLHRLIDDDDVQPGTGYDGPEDEEQVPLGYTPVSQMPARWRDFYMNHWRRGADKSKITAKAAEEADDNEEEEVRAPAAKTRGTRVTKITRGAAAAGGSRTTGSARSAARRDDSGDEDDYEGDLGGPGAPAKSSYRSWMGRGRGRGRGGARRGGGARKKTAARKR